MRRTLSLNDDHWQVGSVPRKPYGGTYDLGEVKDWLPATVPGDIRLALLRSGAIADPYIGMNNSSSQWIDALDWWYVKELELDAEELDRAFVIFEGIDYQSAVFWNGREIGRHVGMFSRQIYELPPDRAGLIAVRVWGSGSLPRPELNPIERFIQAVSERFVPGNPAFPDRITTLKCQMSFGWDFAPRLLTSGIWDDVSLVQARGVFVRDVWVQAVPDGRVLIRLAIDSEMRIALRVDVVVTGSNFNSEPQQFEFDLAVSPIRKNYELRIQLKEPRLWNPWDRGEPNLYALEVRLFDELGELDSTTTKFGLRSIDLAPNPGAPTDEPPWTFFINDNPMFIRGANWVPADAIPGRVTRKDYEGLVGLARSANINLLRVWGGGLREKSAFYDICDKEGILIWQEFPFSGAPFDFLSRGGIFFEFANDECGAIVRVLRNHPSLALWCGGNEFSAKANAQLVHTLRAAVAENDGTRPFKPASPSGGEQHNWRVWHWGANTRDFRKDDFAFFGEFGLQSPPGADALGRFISSGGLWPPAEEWSFHNAELEKIWRYARGVQPSIGSLQGLVQAAQDAQLRGLQVMIEHARRHKGRVSGCAFWQFDEPWPAICWSVVDYNHHPKPAYFKIKDLYNPVLVSFEYALAIRAAGDVVRGRVWVINDKLSPLQGELAVALDGRRVLTLPVNVPGNASAIVGELDFVLTTAENRLEFELVSNGELVSTNEYDMTYCDRGEISCLSACLEKFSSLIKS